MTTNQIAYLANIEKQRANELQAKQLELDKEKLNLEKEKMPYQVAELEERAALVHSQLLNQQIEAGNTRALSEQLGLHEDVSDWDAHDYVSSIIGHWKMGTGALVPFAKFLK